MAKMQELVDHPDILQQILIRVAKSSDGAKDFARAVSVCKAFRSFVDNKETLRAVSFDRLEVDGHWELFRPIGGLICRCAKAGQEQAKFIMGKIIIKSTADIMISIRDVGQQKEYSSLTEVIMSLPTDTIKVFWWLYSFSDDTAFPDFIGYHVDFVKIFLSRARLHEFEEMEPCLSLYMKYFMLRKCRDSEECKGIIDDSINILKVACSIEDFGFTPPMVTKTQDMCRGLSRALQKCGVEKEKLGGIGLEFDDSDQTTLPEKLDMCLKCLIAVEAIKERFHELFQHSSEQNFEKARGILSWLETLNFGSMKDELKAHRAGVSECLENKGNLLSIFHNLFL